MNKFHKKVILGQNLNEEQHEVHFKDTEWGKNLAFVGDTEFDGHYTLWGFEYYPYTYLKSSGLSGDEWRKGGEIRYYADRKQVYSDFCRDPIIGIARVGATLLKLMELPWDKIKIGTKVWYRELPCVIDYICEEQGCVGLVREDGNNFPDQVWRDADDGCFGEGDKHAKVEIISEQIFWYRK